MYVQNNLKLKKRKAITDKYGIFPFGAKVTTVEQAERSPKKVFILGVYASAVHARWLGADGQIRVNALAVASEPEIFWRGDGEESIINKISVPDDLGRLVPAARNLNGPSGRSLDNEYLNPLGIDRKDVWLSDIYPYARMNQGQKDAIDRAYMPNLVKYNLPKPTLQPAPTSGPGKERCKEIWEEFLQSKAEILILLGDRPIEWFLSQIDPKYRKLSDFGIDADSYGRIHNLKYEKHQFRVLPLVHPRQASRLGLSNAEWAALHQTWKSEAASGLI